MPTVPLVTRQVTTRALPGARKSASNTALALGAGIEEAKARKWGEIGQVGGQIARAAVIGTAEVARIRDEEAERAKKTALLEADNAIAEDLTENLYKEGGWLAQQGKLAAGLPKAVYEHYDKLSGDIAAKLTTDDQRAAFAELSSNRRQSLDLTIRRHVSGQLRTYEAGEVEAKIKNGTSAAIANALDPRAIGVELQGMIDTITTHGPGLGLGPDQIKLRVEAIQTTTHVGVIERLLALKKTGAAKAYFEEAGGQINGEALARIEGALKEGTVRAEGQKKTETILGQGGDLAEQLARAREIEDADVQDDVVQRIKVRHAEQESAKLDHDRQWMRSAYDILDKTQDVSEIPEATWRQFDGGTRSAMLGYARQRAAKIPRETDERTLYNLKMTAAKDPEGFAKMNLMKVLPFLSAQEFDQMSSLQMSVIGGTMKAEQKVEVEGWRTTDRILRESLDALGLDPTPKDRSKEGKVIANVSRALDGLITTYTAENNGKKPNQVEVQAMADRLLSTELKAKNSGGMLSQWWSGTETTKNLRDLTFGDIPEADKKAIERAQRITGRPTSESAILDAYIQMQAGGR